MSQVNNSVLTSEQKDMIFENMSDGIMTIDKDGNITYYNSACKKIFNIDTDIIGESFADNFMTNNVESVLAELAAQPVIQVLSRKDAPIYGGAKLIIDVTEEIEDLNKKNDTTE